MNNICLYKVDMKLIRDYAHIDDNIMSVSPQINKQNRPFVGVIVINNNRKYCIPLSSPKEKHRKMKSGLDMIKVFDESDRDEDKQFKLIGILNNNNMIPVEDCFLEIVDLNIYINDDKKCKAHKELMQNQLKWCRENSEIIINKANKVYNLVVNNPEKNKRLVARSVDFLKLEKVLERKLKS